MYANVYSSDLQLYALKTQFETGRKINRLEANVNSRLSIDKILPPPPPQFQDLTLTSRFMAELCAALTKPSSSAPEKFFVCRANSSMFTSSESLSCSRILVVWMFRIWLRPCSSGRPARKVGLCLFSFLVTIFTRCQLYAESIGAQRGGGAV